MDPIKDVLKNELDRKTLSPNARRGILLGRPREKRNFVPLMVAACICALVLFLISTVPQETPSDLAQADAKFGAVDKAVLTYFNQTVPLLQNGQKQQEVTVYSGDAYLMRLALENNSGLFYSDSGLPEKDRLLVSKLLHNIQEAVWQNEMVMTIDPVQSIEELVQQAPVLIEKLAPAVEIPYMTMAEEKKHQWNLYSFDQKRWISYFVVLALLVLFIIYLLKHRHWIICTLVILLTFASFMQPFMKTDRYTAAYDEQTLLEVVTRGIEKHNIRLVGEPELQYAASIHETRTALVSYEDGLTALAIFKYQDGKYVEESIVWHSGTRFQDTTFETKEEGAPGMVLAFGFKAGHDVETMHVMSGKKTLAEHQLTDQDPAIVYVKVPGTISGIEFSFWNAQGELAE